MDFPRTVDEITPEWLTQVLRESGAIQAAKVESFETTEIGFDTGATGAISRLEPSYDRLERSAPTSLIAKLGDTRIGQNINAPIRPLLEEWYKRESHFYNSLASDCGIRTPMCYMSAFDGENLGSLYLLEDVGHLRVVDQSENCTIEDARSTLLSLARMHAKWWDSDRLDDHPSLKKYGSAAPPALMQGLLEKSIEPVLEAFGDRLPHGIGDIVRKFLPKLPEVAQLLASSPRTLVHGDFRLANIFFDDSADQMERLVAYDWQ